MLLIDEVLDNTETARSIVKWCPALVISSHLLTALFIDEVLGNVEATILTSIVKWCQALVVSSHWVTVVFIDEVLGNVELIIQTSILVFSGVCPDLSLFIDEVL